MRPKSDLSQAKDQEYLGDGLAEEILNQLAQVPALRLVGRTSSFSFKGKDDDLRSIGSKLGVKSHEIVPREAEFEHERLTGEAGVGSVPVVTVQPARKLGDALGDSDLTVDALRRYLESAGGFGDGRLHHRTYWQFWTTPRSGTRAHPEFEKLLIQAGVADYCRQSGRWGDGGGPTEPPCWTELRSRL